jgi:hypothetical protein
MRAIALALLACGCLALAPQAMQMRLDGRWEIVRDRADGRFEGASVRSFHPGDVLDVRLSGVGFRIYGVTGPSGGRATVVLENTPITMLDFYSPVKRTDVLLYTSPPIPAGTYAVDLVVGALHDVRSRGTYVNIDKVEVVR